MHSLNILNIHDKRYFYKQNYTDLISNLKKIAKLILEPSIGSVIGIAQSRFIRESITVFCYHDVTDNPSDFSSENALNVHPDVFEFQLRFINENFNVVTPSQLMDSSLPTNAALLTFDDGFKSFFVNAVPILRKYHLPALIFLNMGPIQGETFWSGLIVYLCGRKPDFIEYLKLKLRPKKVDSPAFLLCSQSIVEGYLQKVNEDIDEVVSHFVGKFADETDLEQASQNPYVFYGNHSYSHFVSCLMSDEEFLNDIDKNANLLKIYPNYINYFAFPFGVPERAFTHNQVKLLLQSGVKKVFSSASRCNPRPFAPFLDRIALKPDDDSPAKIRFRYMAPFLFKRSMNSKPIPSI